MGITAGEENGGAGSPVLTGLIGKVAKYREKFEASGKNARPRRFGAASLGVFGIFQPKNNREDLSRYQANFARVSGSGLHTAP
jgi:hypothetical protein